VKAAIAAGEPAISVDTKKKELIGDFKNACRELRRHGVTGAKLRAVADIKRADCGFRSS
jgi:hypothetical protein